MASKYQLRTSWIAISKASIAKCASLAIPAMTAALALSLSALPAAAATTSTTLSITAYGSPASTIVWPAAVTLTATVTAAGAPVTQGTVNFCDAASTICDGVYLLGSAQLTPAGTAAVALTPRIGSHSCYALFVGTNTNASSASSPTSFTVTGKFPSTTTIAQSGSAGDYTLTAKVGGTSDAAPTGDLSLQDTTEGNTALASAPLGQGFSGLGTIESLKGQRDPAASGDFNGDGILDVVDFSGSVLLGNGDGTFTAGSVLPISNAKSIIAGDFNGDGNLDIVASGSAQIFLGDGAGNFTPVASAIPAGQLVVADFNGDGALDLASLYSGSIGIALNDGTGNFTPGPTLPAVPDATSAMLFLPYALQVGDFNGDGKADLAFLWGREVQQSGDVVDDLLVGIYLNDGTGNFPAVPAINSVSGELDEISEELIRGSVMAAGDLNNDGKTDLAVGYALQFTDFNGPTEGYVYTLLSDGEGGFHSGSGGFGPLNNAVPNALAVGNFSGKGLEVATIAGPQDGSSGSTFLVYAGSIAVPVGGAVLISGDFIGNGRSQVLFSGNALTTVSEMTFATATASDITVLPAGSGTHAVLATYPGDTSYAVSTSATTSLTSVQGTASVALSASATSVPFQSPVTLTAKVTGGGSTPTGGANFYDGKTLLAPVVLDASGMASYTTRTLSSGPHSFTVLYGGDTNYPSVTSSALTVTVGTVAPTITLTASTNTASYGSPILFTAKITGAEATPTGNITVYNGTTALVVTPLTGETTTFSLNSLAPGSASITVSYSGDVNYSPMTSNAVTVTIVKAIPRASVTPSATSITAGSTDTFTIAVSGTGAGVVPTGSVTVYNGTTALGSSSLAHGTATFATAALPAGTASITASYSGDSNYNTVIAPPVAVTVAGFTLSGSTVTLERGATTGNTATINIAPVNGYTGSVTLTASITGSPAGATNLPTLSFGATSPVTLAGSTPASATLTITTTAPASAALTRPTFPRSNSRHDRANEFAEIAAACLLIFVIPARKRNWRRMPGVVLVTLLIGGAASCGGGSSSSGGGGTPRPGTTAGNYQISITGTSGAATSSTAFTLTVH